MAVGDQARKHRAKLAWRCRRGTKELDILLQRFFDQHYDGLDAGERQTFEQLLEVQDPTLADWIWGRAAAPPGGMGEMIERIRSNTAALS